MEKSGPPNYIVKKPEFYCPLSPQLLWHHGLIYTECPLVPSQRDMGACKSCPLKGKGGIQASNPDPSRPKRKKQKSIVPKIGKSYSSK